MSTDGGQDRGMDGDKVLVAEYALGLLDAAEHQVVARRLATEPALAAELRLWQARLSSLDGEFAETRAPAAVLSRVERRLFGAAPAAAGFWNSLALWRSLAAGGVAVAAVAIGFNLMQPPRLDPSVLANQLVAAMREEGSNVSFVALFSPATGSVRLAALSGEPVPDKDFELWAIEGAAAPVSMGVIPVTARADVKIPAAVLKGFGAGTILAVTLEPKGGSPTGDPTGPIVAKGAATAI